MGETNGGGAQAVRACPAKKSTPHAIADALSATTKIYGIMGDIYGHAHGLRLLLARIGHRDKTVTTRCATTRPNSSVTVAEYTDHVERARCWFCHEPTHRSHAAQRQCPKCRRKWSYWRRKIELDLAYHFATGFKAAEAARQCKVVYRTAWIHFLRFEQTARQ